MKKLEHKFRPVTFTIDEPLLILLDQRLAEEQVRRPDRAVTRSEIARALMRQALSLAAVEGTRL